ncbi:MAG: hypothetical protein HY435_00200 [Candidatus Liptonbacteria bacterium]|nr:hypothetical protein [Candidatus Liptonbacteria bacterium]
MKFLMRISPEWSLRITLGAMYLYSGQDLIRHPSAWTWAIPFWLRELISKVMTVDAYIRFQGAVEVVFALVLLAWFARPVLVKWIALLSTLEFAAILALAFMPFSEANFLITFRDIGLLGASLALFFILLAKEKPLTSTMQ